MFTSGSTAAADAAWTHPTATWIKIAMDVSQKYTLYPVAVTQRVIDRIGTGDHTVVGDLMFLHAWHAGLVPWPSSTMRVRQIYRANPIVAARDGIDRNELPA